MSLLSVVLLAGLTLGAPAHAQEVPAEGTAAAPDVPEDAPPSEDGAPADTTALEARVEAQEAELQALREALLRLEGQMTQQAEQVEGHATELAQHRLKLLPPDGLKFDIEGYYRVRAYLFSGLTPDAIDPTKADKRPGTYMTHRLRLRTTANYRDLAKLSVDIQALDGVVWGDNQSLASTAVFAGDPSETGVNGQRVAPIQFLRAWMEFKIPVGLFRVGRQPSHWGMGLLANSGDGFDDDFGENWNGNSFDRVLFATNPVSIVNAITGGDKEIPILLAFGVDRLVEDPLIQYYGYKCEVGQDVNDEGVDPRCDSDGDGLTDVEHGYTEDREEDDRPYDWWADPADDVFEMIYVLMYKGEGIQLLGSTGDLVVGGYVIHRLQKETDSQVVVPDFYLRAKLRGVFLESEVVTIFGNTRGIALPGSFDASGRVDDPLSKKAMIAGFAARAGYERADWRALVETGFASGDNNVVDNKFTGRPLHPDHNVGLLIYEEILSRVTSRLWTDSANGLWSNGGVYNSFYLNPRFKYTPMENLDLLAGVVMAWPHKPDGRFIRCREGDNVECAQYSATQGMLGWEVDLAVKHTWHEHLNFTLESGFARTTDRIPLASAGLPARENGSGNFFTLQSRMAYVF